MAFVFDERKRICFDICTDDPAADYEDADEDVLAAVSGTWYEVVYPVQVRSSEEMPDLDTRDHRARHKVSSV